MKKHIIFISITILVSCITSCKKLADGFLSTSVRYEETPMLIPKGRVYVSSALNMDGSSIPASVKLLHIYDSAGNNVDDVFMKQYTIKGWKAAYDPDTDTTLSLIEAKQTELQVTPMEINAISGQVEANYTTLNVPSGLYSFDLQVANGAGSKTFEKIGQIQLLDPVYADNDGSAPYDKTYKVGDENTSSFAAVPIVTYERIADTPNVIILKIIDKNGTPFNPKAGEIIRRPNTGVNPVPPYLQTLQDYSLSTTLYSDRMEFIYGTVPFPLISKGNGFNIYYRIPSQYFHADDQETFPDGAWSFNPRFGFRAYVQGTYIISVQLPDLIHK